VLEYEGELLTLLLGPCLFLETREYLARGSGTREMQSNND